MKNPPKKLPQGSSSSPPNKVFGAKAGRQPDEQEHVVSAYRQQFSGPLPHPEILKDYDAIVPGAAKSIIQSFITEGEHRRALESREVAMCEDWARADLGLQKRGQLFGFILAVIGVGGGLVVAATGAPGAGAAVSGVSLAGIVIAFVRQRHMSDIQADEDRPKSPDASNGQGPQAKSGPR